MKGGCSEVEVVAASVSRHSESVSREEGARPPTLMGAGLAGKKPRKKAVGSGFCRGGDLGPVEDHTGDPATGRCLTEEKACRPGQQPGRRPAGGKGSFPRPPRCSRRGPSVPPPGPRPSLTLSEPSLRPRPRRAGNAHHPLLRPRSAQPASGALAAAGRGRGRSRPPRVRAWAPRAARKHVCVGAPARPGSL